MRVSMLFAIIACINFHNAFVSGWWDTGHMLVAEVSWKYLSNESVPQAVRDALLNAVSALPTYTPVSSSYVTAAPWMDDIKTRGISQFTVWHYVNVPLCAFPSDPTCQNVTGYPTYAQALSPPNVVWAIDSAYYTIKNAAAGGFERGFAVKNLLHLVGDIHQPLHVVARYSPETPNGDEGGNLFKISGFAPSDNLHGFWDSGAGLYSTSVLRPLNESSQKYLSDQADYIINVTQIPQLMNPHNITEWAMESLRYCEDTVYFNITYGSVPSDEYVRRAQQLVYQRIGVAGYRLAMLLKDIVPCSNTTGNCPDTHSSGSGNRDARDLKSVVVGFSVLSAALAVLVVILSILLWRTRQAHQRAVQEETAPFFANR